MSAARQNIKPLVLPEGYRNAIRPTFRAFAAQHTECRLTPEGETFAKQHENVTNFNPDGRLRTSYARRKVLRRRAEVKTRFWDFLMRVRPTVFEVKP